MTVFTALRVEADSGEADSEEAWAISTDAARSSERRTVCDSQRPWSASAACIALDSGR